jgi:hypothetical protein
MIALAVLALAVLVTVAIVGQRRCRQCQASNHHQ